jgi:hypothetical protein
VSRTTTALRKLARERDAARADLATVAANAARMITPPVCERHRVQLLKLGPNELRAEFDRVGCVYCTNAELARAREWWHEEPGDQRDKRAVLDWLERCPLAACPVAPTVEPQGSNCHHPRASHRELAYCTDCRTIVDRRAPTVEPAREQDNAAEARPQEDVPFSKGPPATTRDGGECPPVEAAREVCGTWRGICLSCHGKGYLPNPDFEKGPRCWDCHGTGRGGGK